MEKVYEQLGQPAIADLCGGVWSREPSTPEYLVGSAEFFRAGTGLLTEDISIIGYTDSFRIKIPEALSTDEEKLPNGFAAPEILFGFKGNFPSDLWALGSIIYQIRAGQYLLALWTSHQQKQSKRFLTRLKTFPPSLLGLSSMKMAFRTNVDTN